MRDDAPESVELPPGWTVRRHLEAYAAGYFPMADGAAVRPDAAEIGWYRPPMRAVLPLDEGAGLHVPRTVERELRRGTFEFATNAAFGEVVRACAEPRSVEDGVWINARMIRMYEALRDAGRAHSVEAWRTDPSSGERALVGGVFGLSIGGAFFAESMFHRRRARCKDGSRDPLDGTNASSCALVVLARHLRSLGFALLDVQIANQHTRRFGVREVPTELFVRELRRAVMIGERWREL